MITMKNDYYVYMYIDPRNNQDFYYGKGRGKRKLSHLRKSSDSKVGNRIKAIKNAGTKPVIRVIAAGLTEDEAHLIETTLLWKLGHSTVNVAAGHKSKMFRPKNTLHIDYPGFDIHNKIYRGNVGESKVKSKRFRSWDDMAKFGFVCAGSGKRWIDLIKGLNVGDILVMYLTGKGFVGIGKVMAEAVPAINFMIRGKSILDINTIGKYDKDKNNLNKCQYMAKVKWIKKVSRDKAIKASGKGFNLRGSLVPISSNTKMIQFINRSFNANLNELVKK
jgi:hypothetical protein